MNYENLDNEELLGLALDAINRDRDADAVVMLKTLLQRVPHHVHAQYLLAAQHAQLGMHDRAEAGFRAVVANAPELTIARFQLGQLLVMKGAGEEAKETLQPVSAQHDALGAYARAMLAAADDDVVTAVSHLESGLALPQEIPALAADMQRLHAQLQHSAMTVLDTNAAPEVPVGSMLLAGYGRGG